MDRGVSTIEARITDAAHGQRIDKALADVVADLSRERIKALMAAGHVHSADGPVADGKRKVAAGQVFTITLPAAVPLDNIAQDIPLVVAYEDEHLIVVDKPAGLVVHPAAGNLDGTLVNALLHHCAGKLSGIGGVARPGIVHRIDKDTSGLLVVAKNDVTHEGLARQFKDHSIDRRYLAIAAGRVLTSTGMIDAPLARSPNDRKKMAIVHSPTAKHAVTHFRKLRQLNGASLIECRLETGRTHQVRVHMASIGHPLLGDPVYAGRRPALKAQLETLDFARQALHAAHLGFIHPVTKNALSFDSDLPADMQELLDHLHV
ncbi:MULTISPECIES: RluA family pseudouridine synthase [unclassified Sphingomonas]|uniref:RluA family pseudouridine synthase n=1 Tax=unclassified Sphingomonas TaxID=196159 RepID=UPI0007012B74|nr:MULTISPECIES: RluA family pseudouridine synthase [unclassified Sphingomonas]KQM28437.1 pseudouridine synthase [Sphingomonas sp. Leaf9]KQM45143.1 pseudouridine synthase [Sphingomonas sp. Leaf11]